MYRKLNLGLKNLNARNTRKSTCVLNKNKLLLNVDKTELVVFGEEKNLEKIIYREETYPQRNMPKILEF